jgi:hypothetical protein
LFAGTRFKMFSGQPLFEVEDATFADDRPVDQDSVTALDGLTCSEKKTAQIVRTKAG